MGMIVSLISLASFSEKTIAEPQTDENNVYSEGLVGKINLLNPVLVDFNRADRDISQLIFSSLSVYDPIQRKVVEDIAIHTLSMDKKTYTFSLKENTLWHDGTSVTAEDIYFTYHDVIQNPAYENPAIKPNFEGVEIRKIDKKTVTFTIKEPNSFFFTSTTIGLLPAHILKGVPIKELNNHPFNHQPIGTGPYRVVEPVKFLDEDQSEVSLIAFDKYYKKISNIKNIRFHTYPDKETLLKNKDLFHGISSLTTTELKNYIEPAKRFTIYSYTLPQITGVFINTDDEILKERKLRLALLKGIDKNVLMNILRGKQRIDTPLLELKQSEWLHEFNQEQAMGALYDARWRFLEGENQNPEKQKVRVNAEGIPLQLTITTLKAKKSSMNEDDQIKILDYLEKSWESLGIDIKIEILDSFEELQEKIRRKDYQLLLHGQHLGYNFDMYYYWHSSQSNENGLNLSNYRNLKADSLIEKIRIIYEYEEKKEKLTQLGSIMNEDIPVIVLYTPVYYYAIDSRIKDVNIGYPIFQSDRLTTLTDWTIN